MQKPFVSILLPTYNYERYLPQSIASCLAQSYDGPLELVIVDNASSDNSREVIKSFDDPRIRLVENPATLSMFGNCNKALSLARGEIVKFIFSDDLLAETAVERMVAAFGDPRVQLVFCSAKIIDAEGRHTRTHRPYPQSKYLPGRDEARRCVMRGNYIGAPSAVAFRAGAAGRAGGGFNEALQFHADQEMWVRILLDGDGYFLSDPLASTREHDGSETRRLERTRQVESETRKFITCCLQNERIRSLLSESEVRELNERREGLAATRDAGPGPHSARVRIKGSVKRLVEGTPLYGPLLGLRQSQLRRRAEENEVAEWERGGRPAPPPHLVKERVLRRYAKRYGLGVLVETGTYLGDMVEAMKPYFDKIYSIELSEELYERAKARFDGDGHVELINGDSGKVLGEVMKGLTRPALFWLDGHYSAGITAKGETDTPVYEELRQILEARPLGHVVIIDDARLFGSDPDYPTVEALKEFVGSRSEGVIQVEDDSIRIVLRG
ncbi:MAG TPA: glycosyltransferase [Pyrinomonadaceae bacterium]|jgi:glycosyltransferase involved in cell wall biosynthesis|nr:glycosyltransferase [Pyrinomonadaceae bacterium]